MWSAYQRDRDDLEHDMALCRSVISKLSTDLKADMNCMHKKCVPVWVEKKRVMKKEVRGWVDWLLMEWEDDEIQEIEDGLGPMSYDQSGEMENDDSEYESEDEEESDDDEEESEDEDEPEEKEVESNIVPSVKPSCEVYSDRDREGTVSEMGEGAERGELLGPDKESDEPVKRTQSGMEDVVKSTEPDEPETKKRRMN